MDYLVATPLAWVVALLQAFMFAATAPLLVGWIRKVKARLQNRRGPPVLQPYRDLWKLFGKEVMVAQPASWLFRAAPYVVFSAIWMTAAMIPLLAAPAYSRCGRCDRPGRVPCSSTLFSNTCGHGYRHCFWRHGRIA